MINLLLVAALFAQTPSSGEETSPPRLIVVERTITLEQCRSPDRISDWLYWQVDYRLRNDGPTELMVPPSDLVARVDGFVSNSRVPGHGTPKSSLLSTSGTEGLMGVAVILPIKQNDDVLKGCKERLVLQAWPAESGAAPPPALDAAGSRTILPGEQATLRLAPGREVRVRLRLEHEHPLYGLHDPLLGRRTLELRLGPALIKDELPLDRYKSVKRQTLSWPPPPPAEFLDCRVSLSPPDSMHLEAHVPGKQSYRYPEFHGVRYGSRMRLSFWYLIAPASEGQYQARISQYREVPNSWRTLYDGEVIEPLTVVDRWVHVERVFRVEPEATTLALDFRIVGADVIAGDMWIDDVRLEPDDGEYRGP